jgi:hypothetical protein
VRAEAERAALTHRKKIHMLTRRRSELVTVRISLADAMVASQMSKLVRAGVGVCGTCFAYEGQLRALTGRAINMTSITLGGAAAETRRTSPSPPAALIHHLRQTSGGQILNDLECTGDDRYCYWCLS